jgi:hypothetical protein
MRFAVIGCSPIDTNTRYVAADRARNSTLMEHVEAGSGATTGSDNDSEVSDLLDGFDEGMGPPPVPERRCCQGNRTCSRYGMHFFFKSICDVCPPAEEDVEEVASVYVAANKPVTEMSNSEKRDMMY